MKIEEIHECRSCGCDGLTSVVNLGEMQLAGRFPRPGEVVPRAPLEVMLCDVCGLAQLRHTADLREQYGPWYGYRSSLNRAMVEHLRAIVARLTDVAAPQPGDVVVDIGANDGTLINAWPMALQLVAVEPIEQLRTKYRQPCHVVSDFFSAAGYRREMGATQARVITSVAMFYDLPAPRRFAADIASILAPDGVWLLEVAYAPTMLRDCVYDTICHEHLEYYGLRNIADIAGAAGLRVFDAGINDTNGGSLWAMVCHEAAPYRETATVPALQRFEELALHRSQWTAFASQVRAHPERLRAVLEPLAGDVWAYGASTKGNVLLQHCGIGPAIVPYAAEVNSDKAGCVTATGIPIVLEEVGAPRPGAYLVLPWHFRRGIVRREREYVARGGRLVFPLPAVEVVGPCVG